MPFVLLQLLLGQGECFLADQGGNGDLDPVLARTFVIGAVAAGHAIALAQRSRDSLSRTEFGLAVAGPATIRRVAQQTPDRRSFPSCGPGPGRDLTFVEHAG